MAVCKILKMGDPRLWLEAEPVTEFNTPALKTLIEDMLDTMRANSGAGLAAPQIGIPLRVIVFEVRQNPRYPEAEAVPLTILINPAIEPVGEEGDTGWEACLSVPGLRGLVSRPGAVRYRGQNEKGEFFERLATGFHARVVQHENDHLNGILYPMRVENLRYFGYEDTLFPDT